MIFPGPCKKCIEQRMEQGSLLDNTLSVKTAFTSALCTFKKKCCFLPVMLTLNNFWIERTWSEHSSFTKCMWGINHNGVKFSRCHIHRVSCCYRKFHTQKTFCIGAHTLVCVLAPISLPMIFFFILVFYSFLDKSGNFPIALRLAFIKGLYK